MVAPTLMKKECLICGEVGLSLSSEHYCQKHMKSFCCMSNKYDKWGRSNHCNDLLPPVEKVINGKVRKFCMSHWKTHVSKCRYCNRDSVTISDDGRGYCAIHKITKEEHNRNVRSILEKTSLPNDIVLQIQEK